MREFDHSISIAAPPALILDAFFNAGDLTRWWLANRSVCIPRPLGSYAIEWEPSEWRDDMLGRLGGAFCGTVIDFKPGREFFVADFHWLPPDGEPLGPMAFAASCAVAAESVTLRVRQSGGESSARWSRYYELLAKNMPASLNELKKHVEGRPRA